VEDDGGALPCPVPNAPASTPAANGRKAILVVGFLAHTHLSLDL
jgi:hypothetical protein